MTPSVPNETRPASHTSAFDDGEQSSTSPEAVTKRNPFTSADSDPSVAPVPCVPVPTAPAIACRSMSPWFLSPSPASWSGRPSAWILLPARTRAVSADVSLATTPARASSEISVPSLSPSAVNEWPEPTTRTGAGPSRTAAASSPSLAGLENCFGADLIQPDQFAHAVIRSEAAPSAA